MLRPLATAIEAVKLTRQANDDVFLWPSTEWTMLYCHEELGELARAIQIIKEPDHARNTTDTSLSTEKRLQLEWGQVFMMLATAAIQLDIDPDAGLDMALKKIETVARKKRTKTDPYTCPNCNKTIYPNPYSRNWWLGSGPAIYLDGSTNYCTCQQRTEPLPTTSS